MRNYCEFHCHPASFDSASTPEAMIQKEIELGTGYITTTDHGSVGAVRQIYDLCRGKFKGQVKIIPGIEAYFRSDSCGILTEAGVSKGEDGTFRDHLKYMHVTLHAQDQEAFETIIKRLSKADLRAEQHGSERKPLFDWDDLEEIGSKNVTAGSSCLIGMCGRHLLEHNDYYSAVKYYEKLRGLVKPGNFLVELMPHVCDANYTQGCFFEFSDGTKERLPDWKKITVSDIRGNSKVCTAKALSEDFLRNPKSVYILSAVMTNRKMTDREPKAVSSCVYKEGPIPNECTPLAPNGDVQLGVNKFVLEMARRYGDKVVVSGDSHMASKEDKVVQDVRLGGNWKFLTTYSRQSSAESFEYFKHHMGVSEAEFEGFVENSYAWASTFDNFTLKTTQTLPTKFYPEDTLNHTLNLIEKHGRMDWSKPEYVARLKSEIELLNQNGVIDLLPYFMPFEEISDLYTRNSRLCGVGRGSAAGLLINYLLNVTHADPLRYKLSQDRFLTKTRIESGKFPDIDFDTPDRDLLVDPEDSTKGWLADRFGDCQAQLSTDTSLKLKSSILDVFRAKRGDIPPEIKKFCSELPTPPMGIDDKEFVLGYSGGDGSWVPGLLETNKKLQEFVLQYPEEWEVATRCLKLTRQKSRHASAWAVMNAPISDTIPMTTVGGSRCTAYTAAAVEASGALKMDFLIVKSLKDIEDCIKLVQDRNPSGIDWKISRLAILKEEEAPSMVLDGKNVPYIRCVPNGGQFYDIWDLPNDTAVFNDICEGNTQTVFQLHTPAARQWLKYFNAVKYNAPDGTIHKTIDSIEDISIFTALDRPGPLDYFVDDGNGGKHNMLVEYARRAQGLPPNLGHLPILMELLPETLGILTYQEQIQRIFQTLGDTTGAEADEFRVHISKKQLAKVIKDKEVFIKGAYPKLGEEVAEKLWASMETFAGYAFNLSHSISYSLTAYACAYLKHHYPLEWWTSVLKNADRNKINEKFWAYCGKMVDFPDISLSTSDFYIKGDKIQAPLWLLKGIGDKAQEQLTQLGPFSSVRDLCDKVEAWRLANAKSVTKTVVDKKTGGETQVQGLKLATTALNSRVISTLIISGAMDSLFPDKSMSSGQKLALYEETKDLSSDETAFKVTGKVKKKKKTPVYEVPEISPIHQYQMKKEILPAISEDIRQLVKPELPGKYITYNNQESIHHKPIDSRYGYLDYPVIDGKTLAELNEGVPEETICAVAGYVSESRVWSFKDKKEGPNQGQTKTACELTIDSDGTIIKAIKWGGEHGLGLVFEKDLVSSVVVCCLRKRPGKGFGIEDVLVVAHPLTKESK